MKQIYVSVILTVYNTEQYLEESINSIIHQTFKDVEIIIVNDGSTDRSLEIINDFQKKDSRIKIINQRNLGAAIARNNGIKASMGRYLSILDSDDIFDKDMLELMYLQAEKNKVDVLVCPFRNLSDNKENKRGLVLPQNIGNLELFSSLDIKDSIFQITNPAAWNKLFRRDFIVSNNILFQDVGSCNDLYFSYFSLALAKKISILDKSFVSYRNESFGAISCSRGEKFLNIFKAMNQLKQSLLTHNLYDEYTLSYFKRALSNLVYESQYINNKEDISDFLQNTDEFLKDILIK
ncbi:glycosyltransferase, family 2 [Aliarcobacter butzleri 7h1h]|uniref:glycosyltransferase family 2 protein n=1 Tax=Aliarcobacter butzleri TaxID=28197 RepID=UPI00031DCCEC|nr:glycosyltransferase family 2 protein [Aliarcobacter butzleri]AGR78443.1 glycosyltransferase, family 2 [Aliarcobacter butzleri 7h1h]